MHIGVVHTDGSPCGCAEAVAVGLKALGHDAIIVNSEEIEFTAENLPENVTLLLITQTHFGVVASFGHLYD